MKPRDFGLSPSRFVSFADVQQQAIRELSSATSRFDLLIAPTGSGKTVINWATAKIHGNRFLYLVSTKSLEDQILDSLATSGIEGIRGHRNYPCATRKTSDDSFECDRRRDCYYRERVQVCRESNAVVTNYAHHINIVLSGDPNRLGRFDVLICDEAHNLRDIVCDQMSFVLTDSMLSQLRIGLPRPLREDDIGVFLESVSKRILDLEKPSSEQQRIADKIRIMLEDYKKHRWIYQTTSTRTAGLQIEFKPVWPMGYAERFVFVNIPKVVLSSATIREEEMSHLGIAPSELSVVRVPSTFATDRRPIVYYNVAPKISLRGASSTTDKRLIINRIDHLADFHRKQRGIVQCTSYDWARLVETMTRNSERYLSHNSSRGLKTALDEYLNGPPKFLLSPSIKEGADLSYDKCDVIIIPKVPFIDTRSALQRARQLEDKEYQNRETARIIEQMAGRGMRRADDRCVTYILDGQWAWFFTSKWFSDHFRAAFEVRSSPMMIA